MIGIPTNAWENATEERRLQLIEEMKQALHDEVGNIEDSLNEFLASMNIPLRIALQFSVTRTQ